MTKPESLRAAEQLRTRRAALFGLVVLALVVVVWLLAGDPLKQDITPAKPVLATPAPDAPASATVNDRTGSQGGGVARTTLVRVVDSNTGRMLAHRRFVLNRGHATRESIAWSNEEGYLTTESEVHDLSPAAEDGDWFDRVEVTRLLGSDVHVNCHGWIRVARVEPSAPTSATASLRILGFVEADAAEAERLAGEGAEDVGLAERLRGNSTAVDLTAPPCRVRTGHVYFVSASGTKDVVIAPGHKAWVGSIVTTPEGNRRYDGSARLGDGVPISAPLSVEPGACCDVEVRFLRRASVTLQWDDANLEGCASVHLQRLFHGSESVVNIWKPVGMWAGAGGTKEVVFEDVLEGECRLNACVQEAGGCIILTSEFRTAGLPTTLFASRCRGQYELTMSANRPFEGSRSSRLTAIGAGGRSFSFAVDLPATFTVRGLPFDSGEVMLKHLGTVPDAAETSLVRWKLGQVLRY